MQQALPLRISAIDHNGDVGLDCRAYAINPQLHETLFGRSLRLKITPTHLPGVMIVEVDAIADERGLFARTFCADTFRNNGLIDHFPQCNVSWNPYRGTLRGMHYQAEPYPEVKLVRCTRGRILDVAVDLRADSPTYLQWTSVELDADQRNALYIPAGCAHGFQTLVGDCEVFYHMGESYKAEFARGVRWNDPVFAIDWPLPPERLSERDANYPDYQP